MEPSMYLAIVNMFKESKLDANALKDKRGSGSLCLLSNEALTYDGYKVPTQQQVERCLQPLHCKAEGHSKDLGTLRKALSVEC